MFKNKQDKKSPSDYKEPYEFRLLIDDNIICQRYFKINNFNPNSLSSLELIDVIRECANMIDEDLKSKTRIYLWHMAPVVFQNEAEMRQWFANPEKHSKVRCFENIVLRDKDNTEYTWDGEKLILCDKKICDGTFTTPLSDKDTLTYEFAFYVNEKKVASTIFDGVYPHYIRRNIDLSNTRGKFEGDDLSRLSFESYILNRLVYDKQDLIKKIVKEICYVCSVPDNSYYTQVETFKKPNGEVVTYPLNVNDPKVFNAMYAKEIAKAKKYLYGNSQGKSK
jgi:hypothetical protein